jgi:hypothetical protein
MSEDQEEGSRRGPMIALLVVVALVVGGIALTHVLSGVSKIQDCAMSGRSNCAPVGR